MSYTEKIDVLELLINVLREHEDKLDSLIGRLEGISEMVPVSGRLKKTGNSISLTIPKEIAAYHNLQYGDHVQGYIKKVTD